MSVIIDGTNGITAPGTEIFGDGTSLGGATNPIVSMAKGANGYVQSYIINNTNAASSSADFCAYPSNGTDSHGWVDVGITSASYADATYTVTGPNEAYLFGSAPSGSGKTGNLVIATDNTGTANAIQFYVGGFTQSKSATKFAIESTGAHGQLISGTAVASTSGTAIDFTGIPSWVKRITVILNGVSSNGASAKQIQIGSGSFTTTGYISAASGGSTGVSSTTSTTGLLIEDGTNAAQTSNIIAVLTNISGNVWVMASSGANNAGAFRTGGGNVTLGGVLDRVRLTSANGTDTFDAGSVNIFYEG